ncbi:Uncharacterised protein [Escherichia coli]|uniref:Uncharacterized protein n=1 Tax=Escherichia coli TaxID=562 RepID=A0A376U7C0_ECOLX|nr:Uncharacterised protein [Escherichia coli]
MQMEFRVAGVRILINVIHALGVEGRCTTLNTMHLVTFFQQKLCQVRTVLSGYTGDERDF